MIAIPPLTPTRRAALAADVRAVLEALDADVAARKPVCRTSGRCCKFEEYGHSLYVTTAEIHYFANVIENAPEKAPSESTATAKAGPKSVNLPQFFAQPQPRGCPYQIDGLCTAREARPLGCRIYFCDENAKAWQPDVYEKYHHQIKRLHEKHHLPYHYLEWREALRLLQVSQ